MTKRNRILAKLLLAVGLTTGSIYLFAPWEFALHYLWPLPETVQEEVEAAAEQNIAGIIVYVDKKGQAPELYAAGWHDKYRKLPADPNALFKIASIGKLYNAAAVAKLAASGKLSLDKTLSDYMPSLKGRIEHAEEITLKMMVQHRSGIPNYTDQMGFSWGEALGGDAALELILDKPADFAPGTDYGYSNTNYLLLARIMAQVLGHDHTAYIKEEILAPLDLTRTYFSVDEVDLNELMSGYHLGYSPDFKKLDQGFVASAADVAIFLRALNEGTIFSEEARQIYASLYEFDHTGWVLGYNSSARYYRDMDTVVIQFVNTTGDDTVMLTGIIEDRIEEILRNRASEE